MKIRITFTHLLLFAFTVWLIPFLLRLFWIEIPEMNSIQIKQLPNAINDPMQKLARLILEGNKKEAFILIVTNNLKGCIYNVAGGVSLGIVTLINLCYNGFFSANIIMAHYKSGMSISNILKLTLPHSFEFLGFWLSGGIGLYIAWEIINVIRGKVDFPFIIYKKIGFYLVITIIITLLAAYVEAFITSTLL